VDWERHWVVDFGYNNPFVCQQWAVDHDGRRYLELEIYRTNTLVEDHAQEITANFWHDPTHIVCDHDAEDRATLERHLKRKTQGAKKDVSPGIQAVAAGFRVKDDGKPSIYIMKDARIHKPDPVLLASKKPTCTEEEITGYVWDTSDGKKVKEQPLKADDHGCDAMRYGVFTPRRNNQKVKILQRY
jgi:hypothetical protein